MIELPVRRMEPFRRNRRRAKEWVAPFRIERQVSE